MKLNEMIITEALDSKDKIERWLKQMKVKNYNIRSNLMVDVGETVDLFNKGLDNMPVQFGTIQGDFAVRHNKFTNLKKFPKVIGGNLSISHNEGIKNFSNGTGIIVDREVLMNGITLTSLEGISDTFTAINGPGTNFDLSAAYRIKSGGIGLILIAGINPSVNRFGSSKFDTAYEIINKYLGKPDHIYDCQEELINAKLEEFAKI